MTSSRHGVDSTLTPPLSEEERIAKKAAKKLKKDARRAAEALAAAGGSDEEEAVAPVVTKEKKRKAEEEVAAVAVEGEKKKKSKKNEEAAAVVEEGTALAEPVASTSTSTTPSVLSPAITAFLTENRVSHEPETAAAEYPAVLSFAALPLEDGIRKGLSAYQKPTPIQSASFPVMMGGRDVVGIAETG